MPQMSFEQQLFINTALNKKNILVDACIGSGKTTAIQALCNRIPMFEQVLYLTYNKLLKADAKTKIKMSHVNVTNYHGFAYQFLRAANIQCGVTDLIQTFIREKPPIPRYTIMILDEYQDIDQEISEMLDYIKSINPNMQIIAVGDYEQKIYDKTSLDVRKFMDKLLEEHTKIEFTQCFRLNPELAEMLGRIWQKTITGVNDDCVRKTMSKKRVIKFLSQQEPKKLLCLGARKGQMADVLNQLEDYYPDVYNKKTVYASIQDKDGMIAAPEKAAIFTTFDSSKGLERDICIIFDFTELQWQIRSDMPQTKYEILRNIFCVAASRGKNQIIFVESDNSDLVSEQTLSTPTDNESMLVQANIATMFDFKYKEDIEECFLLLKTKRLNAPDKDPCIDINRADALIDLSPCIGNYQEACFFNNYNVDELIMDGLKEHPQKSYLFTQSDQAGTLGHKLLILTALQTNQDRYKYQVDLPIVTDQQESELIDRLKTELDPDEKCTQQPCNLNFIIPNSGGDIVEINGRADVIKDDVVWELKFTSELTHENFLQCACYIIAMNHKKGILWNTRTNEKWEIRIPKRQAFLDAMVNTITKGVVQKFTKQKKNKNIQRVVI